MKYTGEELKWYLKYIAIALIVITIAVVLSITGCTTIEYNPNTQEVKYQSIGGKSFDSLSITRLDDGSVEIVVNKYQHEGIGPIVEGAVRGAIQGVKK